MKIRTAYHSLSDMELVALFKSGDQLAFTEIYERYFDLLYLHAFNRLKDKDEAKDVVQELFSYLWSRQAEIDPKTNFSNYLYAGVRNRIINVIAHKKVADKYRSSLPEWINHTEELTDYRVRERQLAEIIEKQVQLLSPKMKEVFELSRKANLSYKEIAEKLDLTEQSVRSHVKNALKILKAKLRIMLYLFFV